MPTGVYQRKPEMFKKKDPLILFQSHCSPPTEKGCILWTGYLWKSGYGCFKIGGKSQRAHRWILEHSLGRPLGPDKFACHKAHSICGNRHCVALAHLYEGTREENEMDKIADGTWRSNLTPEKVLSIRNDNRPQYVIAEEYGVHQSTICLIKSGKTWRTVGDE